MKVQRKEYGRRLANLMREAAGLIELGLVAADSIEFEGGTVEYSPLGTKERRLTVRGKLTIRIEGLPLSDVLLRFTDEESDGR